MVVHCIHSSPHCSWGWKRGELYKRCDVIVEKMTLDRIVLFLGRIEDFNKAYDARKKMRVMRVQRQYTCSLSEAVEQFKGFLMQEGYCGAVLFGIRQIKNGYVLKGHPVL